MQQNHQLLQDSILQKDLATRQTKQKEQNAIQQAITGANIVSEEDRAIEVLQG